MTNNTSGFFVKEKVKIGDNTSCPRIRGLVGIITDIVFFDKLGYYQADVKFSDGFGDKYSVKTTDLIEIKSEDNTWYDIKETYKYINRNITNKPSVEEWLKQIGFFGDSYIVELPWMGLNLQNRIQKWKNDLHEDFEDQKHEALYEISRAYLHEYLDSKNKQDFPETSERWLKCKGFYDDGYIIEDSRITRWRKMLGLKPQVKQTKYYNN